MVPLFRFLIKVIATIFLGLTTSLLMGQNYVVNFQGDTTYTGIDIPVKGKKNGSCIKVVDGGRYFQSIAHHQLALINHFDTSPKNDGSKLSLSKEESPFKTN